MFEFVLNKNTTKHELKFIDVPNAFYRQHSLNVENGIRIDFLIHDKKKIDDYLYEDQDNLVLLRGSIYHPKLERHQILKKFINFSNEELKQFRGHFNIIFINKKTLDIKVFNDLFGLKPIYYGIIDESFLISSSLHLLKQFDLEISKVNLTEKLIFQHNLLNHTIYQNIYTLEESSILSLKKTFHSQKYFDWVEYLKKSQAKKTFLFNEYINLFNKKIKSFSKSNDKNLVTLTGGHDGRAVLSGFMKENLSFETFSFGRIGSENTQIPKQISEKCDFRHTSINLHEEFENQYHENALLTSILSDGELIYSQQPTVFSVQKFSKQFDTVLTGLLAGEVAGPVHLKTDYINLTYFNHIFNDEEILDISNDLDISKTEKLEIIDIINNRLKIKRANLLKLSQSNNKHLLYLTDMITWGFRKFYGYQMHLMRYHLENIPVFYDFDLVDLLVNSSYNKIFDNSYKSLYKRRNSRKLQINIINKNSKCLSIQKLDRGYSPIEAKYTILTLHKILKYFLRKQKIKSGRNTPDFLGNQWTSLIADYLKKSLNNKNNHYNSLLENIEFNGLKLSDYQIICISNWIYINN